MVRVPLSATFRSALSDVPFPAVVRVPRWSAFRSEVVRVPRWDRGEQRAAELYDGMTFQTLVRIYL